MRILIVDDDPIDVALIKRTLERGPNGKLVIQTADSVDETLQAIKTQHFDVVLVDYKMPETNGIELIYKIRSLTNAGNVAIILMSALEDQDVVMQSLEAGAQDFLPKRNVNQIKLHQAIMQAQKRFELEQKLQTSYLAAKNLAERDALTGLYNRYYFDENLKMMMAGAKRNKHSLVLLAIDVDNFKFVNDTHGHLAGDQLLTQIVTRIGNCLRECDVFARLGGDEFAVIISDVLSASQVQAVVDRIFAAMRAGFDINEKIVESSVSVGAAVFPEDTDDAQQLLKFADIAMYRSKTDGKRGFKFYESGFQTEFNRRFVIQTSINSVLTGDGFRTVYQPVFDLTKNRLKGFETLLRWPEMAAADSYYPDEFIPVAEESGQIIEIGAFVIEQALSDLARFKKLIHPKLVMAINISPVQLRAPELPEFIVQQCRKYDVHPGKVVLEITETALIGTGDQINAALNKLLALGFQLALDDFGMGYSSISHLVNFPISIVKLDKSLQVRDESATRATDVLEALSVMLRRLGLVIVAEGVETEEQLALCKKLDIENVQGYLLGRPCPSQSIIDQHDEGPLRLESRP